MPSGLAAPRNILSACHVILSAWLLVTDWHEKPLRDVVLLHPISFCVLQYSVSTAPEFFSNCVFWMIKQQDERGVTVHDSRLSNTSVDQMKVEALFGVMLVFY